MDEDEEAFIAATEARLASEVATFRTLLEDQQRLDGMARLIVSLARLLEEWHGVQSDIADVEAYILDRSRTYYHRELYRQRKMRENATAEGRDG